MAIISRKLLFIEYKVITKKERRVEKMRRKGLAALALAVVLAGMSVVSFGASTGSGGDTPQAKPSYSSSSSGSSSSGSSSSSSSSSSDTTVHVSSTGVKTTGATSEHDAKGSSFGILVDATTSTGQAITINDRGEAVVGTTAISLAKNVAATAGLPEAVVSSIKAINSGADLNAAGLGLDMSGYAALTGTHAVIVKDNASNTVKEGEPVEVSLFVSSLVDGMNGVSILFFDNVTGQWKLIPAVKIDPVTKTVSFVIQNSGTVCIVHK